MAAHDLYTLFRLKVDPKETDEQEVPQANNGPKAAPAGRYWVATCPSYVDPDWTDDYEGDALFKVRPALHAADHVRRDSHGNFRNVEPSANSRRWGLHPDGPEGRSRTSLTRSNTRYFGPETMRPPITGDWLAEFFEKKAKEENKDLSDWLETSLPLVPLNLEDKTYLDWLDELLEDEVWQGLLFNDHTMDELHEDDVFTMRDDLPDCNLAGTIHPSIDRDKWIAPYFDSNFGSVPEQPRWFYYIDGQQLEYDPVNNDDLWEALQPALLLVSKILDARPEFLQAMMRIWDHTLITGARDTRADTSEPLHAFDTVPPSPNDPGFYHETQFLSDPAHDFVNGVWEILAKDLRIHIQGQLGACGCSHVVGTGEENRPDGPIHYIAINAEAIFPLLVPCYSKSEKTMTSFYVAVVLLHEIAHTLHKMAKMMLFRPDLLPHGLTWQENEDLNAAARTYGHASWMYELYFRNEPVSELGFSFENWLFGGVTSVISDTNHRLNVPGLLWQTIALRSERFPFYRVLDKAKVDPNTHKYGHPILDNPVYDADELFVTNAVHAIAPYFQEAFWANQVGAYGLKVLKMHAVDHKMKATMSISDNKVTFYSRFFDGLQMGKEDFEELMSSIHEEGYYVAWNYLNVLMVERIRLPIAILRWTKQWTSFQERGNRVARDFWKARTIALEIRIYTVYVQLRQKNASDEKLWEFIAEGYKRWQKFVAYMPGGLPPRGSEHLAENGPEHFIQGIGDIVSQFKCSRFLACLPDVYAYFTQELQHMEQAIFDVYTMEEADAKKMMTRFRQPWLRVFDLLTTMARGFVSHMPPQSMHPDLGGWTTRLLELINQFTLLRGYLTSDQRRLNPVEWRHMFLSIGRGQAARKTPSKNWAKLVRDQLFNMSADMRWNFEALVEQVLEYSGDLGPHITAGRLRDQGHEDPLPPYAAGAFTDLVQDLWTDPQEVAVDALMNLSMEPNFNRGAAGMIQTIAQHIGPQVEQRMQRRGHIQHLQYQLHAGQVMMQTHDEAYQARQALEHAHQRRQELQQQINGLQQLQLEHEHFGERERIHEELNAVQGVLEEQLDEVNLRQLRAEQTPEDHQAVAARQAEDQRLQWQLDRLHETEAQYNEELNRLVTEARQQGPKWRAASRARFPAPLADGMLPLRTGKRGLEGCYERAPTRKKRRFRTEALESLIDRPPFLGGPVGAEGRPRPLGRSSQLAMPHGGLPEARYEVRPLEVHGGADIDVVFSLADAVDRWEEMGARQRYEVPRGAVEALVAVAGSGTSGLPREPEPWEMMDWRE